MGDEHMRRPMAAFAVLAVCAAALAGCGQHKSHRASSRTTTTTPTTTTAAPPLAEDALKGLLLNPEQINAVMGATEMKVTQRHDTLSDDSATMEPKECLAIDGAAQAQVYAGSGYSAMREQTLRDGDESAHYVDQAVVLFPTAKQAAAFFDASAKQWPACNEYTHTQSGSRWIPGPVANADAVLSTVSMQENAGGSAWAGCGRALAVRNNVIVDVNTCSADPKDTAVVIAKQIAGKVPAG